jgi:phage-related protein
MSQSISSYRISNNFAKTPRTRTREINFGNGYRQIIVDGFNANEETWNVEFIPYTSATASGLEAILLNSVTSSTNFISWTPPGAGSALYFTAHDIQKTFIAPSWYVISATLRKEFILE